MKSELEKVTKAWPPISRAVRVPHTEADYRELVDLLDRITGEVGENENHPLGSLMDVLGVLIEKYEDEHVPERPKIAADHSRACLAFLS
jgi:HTH-type transcriptional regulator / antitoxin HigA